MPRRRSPIGAIASAETTAEFAEQLSSYSNFTAAEVKALFPKKADKEELLTLLKIVKNATDENDRKAKLIANIDKVASAVGKITMKAVAV